MTGHVVPWNYPMQIIGRSVGAALAMGNACVLKPAEEACLTALAIGRIAQQCGLPAGALNIVPGLGEEAGAALTAHAGVQHLSFTGSVATGRLVQAAAAKHTVPVTLGARRQEPADRLRRCRPGRGAALPSTPASRTPGRPARPARASWSSAAASTRWWSASRSVRALKVGPALADLDLGPLISKRQQ